MEENSLNESGVPTKDKENRILSLLVTAISCSCLSGDTKQTKGLRNHIY